MKTNSEWEVRGTILNERIIPRESPFLSYQWPMYQQKATFIRFSFFFLALCARRLLALIMKRMKVLFYCNTQAILLKDDFWRKLFWFNVLSVCLSVFFCYRLVLSLQFRTLETEVFYSIFFFKCKLQVFLMENLIKLQ